MNEIEKLVKALACLNEAQALVEDFKGVRDFLENVKEPLDDVRTFIADTISINAKR